MARNRLFVDEILSIGLVAKGDNEPAEVVLFKSRDFDQKRREPTLSDYRNQLEEIRKDRYAIILDEIPYQVNKSSLIEKIADLARDKRIDGIRHVQDESDRIGVRVVVELKRDATAEVVLNQLFRFTPMQTSFGCNMLALNGGRPEQLTRRDFLRYFTIFREEVVARRTAYERGLFLLHS